MTQIGRFTRTKSGYSGSFHTLSLDAQIVLVPSDDSGAENAPDYRILLGDNEGLEIGAAWKRIGEKAGAYVSLLLDDPALTQPIRANLFLSSEDKSSWILQWPDSKSATIGTDDMRPAPSLMIKPERLNRACTRARFALLLLIGLAPACTLGGILPAKATPIEHPSGIDPYAVHVAEAARRFGIPAAWIRAVMQMESRARRNAVSLKGAMGLMQIMPDTWMELRRRYALASDPFDPRDNILAGAAYLRELHDRYGSPAFLAAYNAGPRRYEDYLDGRRSLPSETVAYVATLLPLIEGNDSARLAIREVSGLSRWTKASLFVGRTDSTRAANHPAPIRTATVTTAVAATRDLSAIAPRSDGLFVALSSTEHAQ